MIPILVRNCKQVLIRLGEISVTLLRELCEKSDEKILKNLYNDIKKLLKELWGAVKTILKKWFRGFSRN